MTYTKNNRAHPCLHNLPTMFNPNCLSTILHFIIVASTLLRLSFASAKSNPNDRPYPRKLQLSPQRSSISCPRDLTNSMPLTDTLTFYYSIVLSEANPSDNVLCARLESQSEAWIGFGISTNGEMVGTKAVIGRHDIGTVLKYSLNGYEPDLIEELPAESQTLVNAALTREDGMTIVTFAKYLEEEGEIPILANGKNTFLYAEGGSNEWMYHGERRGSFVIDFGAEGAVSYDDSKTTGSTIGLSTVMNAFGTTDATGGLKIGTTTSSTTMSIITSPNPTTMGVITSLNPTSTLTSTSMSTTTKTITTTTSASATTAEESASTTGTDTRTSTTEAAATTTDSPQRTTSVMTTPAAATTPESSSSEASTSRSTTTTMTKSEATSTSAPATASTSPTTTAPSESPSRGRAPPSAGGREGAPTLGSSAGMFGRDGSVIAVSFLSAIVAIIF